MELKGTETFRRTAEVWYDKLSPAEWKVRKDLYLSKGIYEDPSVYRYSKLISSGGSRSSKSYSILQILMLELVTTKNIKITVWRNTKVTCKSSVMEDFQKIIMFNPFIHQNFKENKQLSTFTYKPTGSKIVFTGADDVGKVLGGQQDISFFNEVTEFNEEVHNQIAQRTAKRVIYDYNPSKDFFIEGLRFDEEAKFIHSTFMDNIYCPPNAAQKILSYEPWEPGSYEIFEGKEVMYKGKPITAENQPPLHKQNTKTNTASIYLWLVYGLGIGSEKPEKVYHNWNKITNEYFESLEYSSYLGLDFGTSNPTAAIEVKYDGNGGFFIRERLYKPLREIADSLPTVIKNDIPDAKGMLMVGDSAKELYINVLLEAGYTILKAVKGAGSIEAGIGILKSLTIHYVPSPNLQKEYDNYSFEVDRYGLATDNPIKKDDHLMDALRYIITFLIKYLGIKI
jgi:PBSX family phage terminase large subunit